LVETLNGEPADDGKVEESVKELICEATVAGLSSLNPRCTLEEINQIVQAQISAMERRRLAEDWRNGEEEEMFD
jgi:hypothetical protein